MAENHDNIQRLYYWRNPETVSKIQKQIAASEYLIVYDLETTGVNPISDRMIEMAAIRLRQQNGSFEVVEKLHKYFRLPDHVTLPEEISKLTGITREQLDQAAPEEECTEDLLFFLEDIPLVGYNNIHFDDQFLKQFFYRNAVQYSPRQSFDVFHMAHDFIEIEKVENFKLETVAKACGINAEKYHSAFSDAAVTVELLVQFMKCFQNGETALFCGKKKPEIGRIAYWKKDGQENGDGHSLKRIYVNLVDDPTKIFYNVDSKIWLTSSMEYDMSFIERKSWKLTGAKTEEEFGNFRGRKVIRTKAA